MKKYSDSPLKVRLNHVQEDALQEMMSNTSYCVDKGFYSKSDVVRNSINNVLRDYQKTTLGTR